MNLSDGALVRILTSVRPSETLEEAKARAHKFATMLLPSLEQHIPQ